MRAQQFSLANTNFRGLRFGFHARGDEAYRTLLPVLGLWLAPTIVAVFIEGEDGWFVLASGLTPLLAFPWMHHRLKAYQSACAWIPRAALEPGGRTRGASGFRGGRGRGRRLRRRHRPVNAPTFRAFRFDGGHAEAAVVALRVENGWLIVESAAGQVVDRERLDRGRLRAVRPRTATGVVAERTLEVRDPTRSFARARGGRRPCIPRLSVATA
jgi:hypothetical protein